MYELLTTTRYDRYLERLSWNNHDGQPSRYLLLPFHLERLRDAAVEHEWPDAQSALSYPALHDKCSDAVASYDGDPADAFKIRITLSQAGLLTASASPVPPFKFDPTSPSFSKPLTDSATLYGPAMTLFVDTEPTPPSGLFTSTKTTERTVYNAARSRVGLPPLPSADADVLLYNPDEHITEASVSNVAFYRSACMGNATDIKRLPPGRFTPLAAPTQAHTRGRARRTHQSQHAPRRLGAPLQQRALAAAWGASPPYRLVECKLCRCGGYIFVSHSYR
ncbi:hypothetical protein DFH06DRAFT_551033 [Mycena polygramma]|nr:hypothetical protein DFH06DRAFT_551033 [Mycena polygramma]